jgi:tRNA modification GTPase
MDLAQAEAVAAVIHAGSEVARRNAAEQLAGRLSHVIRDAMTQLTSLRAFVEATIDFPEEDIEMIAHAGIMERLSPIRARLEQLAQTYDAGRLLTNGARVVLVGAPNVGKSSLMNALLRKDRAIVHEAPGTTRDYVDAEWSLGGIAVRLTDTAGLRDGAGDVETIGIERSRDRMEEADLVLMVCDGSRPLMAEEAAMLRELDAARCLVVINKRDLPMQDLCLSGVSVSARTGDGLAALKAAILHQLQGRGPQDSEGVTISALRHKQALDRATTALAAGAEQVTARASAEFVAHHLTQASRALGEIIGEVTTDELLGEIFSRFCIGK